MSNSKKRCRECKVYQPAETMVKHPIGVFCDTGCVIAFTQKTQERDRAKKEAKAKREQQAQKKTNCKALKDLNRRSVSWQHKQTQKAFNRMRVLQELLWFQERGQEPACISCGKPLGGDQWCCGHFKTVGAQGGLRYDPLNTNLQHNRNCNQGLSGDIYGTKNTHGYIQGLKNRFGEDEGQRIIDHCESSAESVKWEWEQLEDMRKRFNAEMRRVETLLMR
jgi:hypothetical protein